MHGKARKKARPVRDAPEAAPRGDERGCAAGKHVVLAAERDACDKDAAACEERQVHGGEGHTEVMNESDETHAAGCGEGVRGEKEQEDEKKTPDAFTIRGRYYKRSRLVRNLGLERAEDAVRKNKSNAVLTLCTERAPHNVLRCAHLHLNYAAVLVGDRYVRLGMLVDNPARVALLTAPAQALHMEFCDLGHHGASDTAAHNAAQCTKLHLLPGVVFVGVPGLRTAYLETELHDNLGLTRLKAQPWETQCGSWCRNHRSHVITTCAFIHFRYQARHTERPRRPDLPIALIPSLAPRLPRVAGQGGVRKPPDNTRGAADDQRTSNGPDKASDVPVSVATNNVPRGGDSATVSRESGQRVLRASSPQQRGGQAEDEEAVASRTTSSHEVGEEVDDSVSDSDVDETKRVVPSPVTASSCEGQRGNRGLVLALLVLSALAAVLLAVMWRLA